MAAASDQSLFEEYRTFLSSRLSINLASTNADGFNEASFAPFIWHQNNCYIYLSALANHYQNLIVNPQVGLLLIEDESSSRNPFSRQRIQMQAKAVKQERDSHEHADVLPIFRRKFGNTFEILESLTDFNSFRLEITKIRYIKGFAQAYDLVDGCFMHLGPPDTEQANPTEKN